MKKYVLDIIYTDYTHKSLTFSTYEEAVEFVCQDFEFESGYIKNYEINEVEA